MPCCKLSISTEVIRLLSSVEPLADENREDPQCGRMMHKELRARLVGDILKDYSISEQRAKAGIR